MSSTNKTRLIGLNNWDATDKPTRTDFNNDNTLVDTVLGNHINDTTKHITDEERVRWYNPYGIDVYYGDGKTSKTVALNFSFDPTICIVFATNTTPGIIDIPNSVHYNYLGIATNSGSMTGLTLSGSNLIVSESPSMYATYEKRSYNELGKTYIVIAIR